MKPFLFVLSAVVVGILLFIGIERLAVAIHGKPVRYCGKVVEKFKTDAGYKVSAKPHIVFYNDSLKRNIDVQVTWNTYANTAIGKNICFDLDNRDLNR